MVTFSACTLSEFRCKRRVPFRFISERTLCHRPSVCLSVCLSSVTFVHHTQAIEIFGDVSIPCGTLAIRDHCIKITEIVPGEPLRQG